MTWPKSVNTTKFHEFLKKLRTKYPFRKMCIYMDNLNFHRSRPTKKVLEEQQFEYIFNPPYSPFANPIEECFSVVKQSFRKARLNKIMKQRKHSWVLFILIHRKVSEETMKKR